MKEPCCTVRLRDNQEILARGRHQSGPAVQTLPLLCSGVTAVRGGRGWGGHREVKALQVSQ